MFTVQLGEVFLVVIVLLVLALLVDLVFRIVRGLLAERAVNLFTVSKLIEIVQSSDVEVDTKNSESNPVWRILNNGVYICGTYYTATNRITIRGISNSKFILDLEAELSKGLEAQAFIAGYSNVGESPSFSVRVVIPAGFANELVKKLPKKVS